MSPCQSYNTLRHGQSQCQDKEFLIKERREQPNLDTLDTIMPHIYTMQSDETARDTKPRDDKKDDKGQRFSGVRRNRSRKRQRSRQPTPLLREE